MPMAHNAGMSRYFSPPNILEKWVQQGTSTSPFWRGGSYCTFLKSLLQTKGCLDSPCLLQQLPGAPNLPHHHGANLSCPPPCGSSPGGFLAAFRWDSKDLWFLSLYFLSSNGKAWITHSLLLDFEQQRLVQRSLNGLGSLGCSLMCTSLGLKTCSGNVRRRTLANCKAQLA